MAILFLSPRQCWPPLSGAKLREYHFAKALGQRGPLTYVHFADPGSQPPSRQDLPFCEQIVSVPKPKPYTVPKLVQGLVSRWPLPVLNYTSEQMEVAVSRVVREKRFELIHLEGVQMTGYESLLRKELSSPRIVYNWHNIESEAMFRYSETIGSPAKRIYAAYTGKRLASIERAMLATSFGHIVCSEREKRQLLEIAPGAKIRVVENGVDTGFFDGIAGTNPTARRHLVFVGLMNYYPNVEAATSFARSIWPCIRERFPHLELKIVGANPTQEVLNLRELPGVEVTGTVPDVRPYYTGALAAVVPLRTGGGTRLKILEAMAAGVVVISSPLGAEGLSVNPNRDILFADPGDQEGWLRGVSDLLESPERLHTLTAAAKELVRTQYDWNILGARLSDAYDEWLRGAS